MPLMLEPSEVSEVQPPGGKWSCICGHSQIIFEPTQAAKKSERDRKK